MRLFRGAALQADGTAAVLTYERGSTAVSGEALAIRLHDRSGPVEVTAPKGEGIVSSRLFEATGGLHAQRGEDSAQTESARFDPSLGDQGRVVGDEPVELAGRGYRMRGDGFTLDPASGEITLRGGTRLVAGLGAGGLR